MLLDCMGHRREEHIILAEWNREKIVLKANADLTLTMWIHFGNFSKEQKASYTLTTKMFLKMAAYSLKFNMFGQKEKILK